MFSSSGGARTPSQAVSVASGGPAEGRKAWMGVMAGLWRAAATMGGGGPLWGAVGPAGGQWARGAALLRPPALSMRAQLSAGLAEWSLGARLQRGLGVAGWTQGGL